MTEGKMKSRNNASNGIVTKEKPSRIFEEQGVQLWEGDVLQLMPLISLGSVDAVITDPPYCSGGTTSAARKADPAQKYCQDGNTCGRPTFVGDMRDQRSFIYWCTLWLLQARLVSKEGAYCLVFIDWRQLPAMSDALQAAGWTWRGTIAWNKGRASRAPHKGFFRHQCEYILWATNGPVPQPLDRGPFDGCYEVHVKQSDKFHITGKPTALMRQLMQVVPVGGRVLDPFAGSASTGVAATLEGRKFIGMEATSDYFDIAQDRLSAALKGEQLVRPRHCR